MKDRELATVPARPGLAGRPDGRLGRYQPLERLGAGGMGEVYAARDPELDRRVAIKVLHGAGTADGRERLRREAQAMARLAHPNVIVVHDVGVAEDRLFVAMELIEGETLRAWGRGEARPWRAVVERMIAAGRGLAAAHRAGVIHRDFKPDNVLLGKDGRVVVSDFGLARVSESERGEERADAGGLTRAGSGTVTGTVAGTPPYMAAEQHLGKQVDERSDQFSFCVTLYEALWGQRPFDGGGDGVESAIAVGMEIIDGRVRPPPAGRRIPGWLRRAALRGLRVDPAERHPSMDALVATLERGLARRRRVVIAAAALATAAAGVLTVVWLADGDADRRCRGLDAPMAATWSPERRAQLAGAGADGARLADAMEARSQRWIDARTQACRETHELGVQSEAALDLRMRCLDRRLDELRAIADRLAGGAAASPAQALGALRDLPDVDACADVDALAAEVPLPDDPALRARVDELRRRRDELAAHYLLGSRRELLPAIERLAADADLLPFPATRGEARRLLADLQVELGLWEPARQNYLAAATAAADARADREAAVAWTSLMYVLVEGLGRAGEAETVRTAADAAVRRAGSPPKLRHEYHMALGALRVAEGDLAAARAAFLEARRSAGDASDRGGAEQNLGNLAYEEGELDPAETHYRAAMAAFAAGGGEPQVDAAGAMRSLARVQAARGQFDEARRLLEQALAIVDRRLGPDSEETASIHLSLGNLELDTGAVEVARAHHRRAVAIHEARTPVNRVDLAATLTALANADGATGDHAQAIADLGRALELYEATVGREHRDYVMAEYNLAAEEIARERCDRARPLLLHAADLLRRTGEPLRLAFVQAGLGECAVQGGQGRQAAAEFQRLLALCGEVDCPPILTALARFGLGQGAWLAGDRGRASGMLAAARAEVDRLGPGAGPQLAQLDAWLKRHRVRLPR